MQLRSFILLLGVAIFLTGCATTMSEVEETCEDAEPTRCLVHQQVPKKLTKYVNSIGMEFILISSGCYEMGPSFAEQIAGGYWAHKHPSHAVTITEPFWMQTTEVTQEQWNRIMGNNPSRFLGKGRPVEQVSWNDVQEFIKKLNAKEKTKTNTNTYRLPTEAEWEFACRGGKDSVYCAGNNINEIGWYTGNSNEETHPVAKKLPNSYGLYDMDGNVSEWVSDWYDKCYYRRSPAKNPSGPETGAKRVLRGNYWSGVEKTNASDRLASDPEYRSSFVGFRLTK